MFEVLLETFPKGVARVILDYEGRIYEAHLKDFVTNIYVSEYCRCLGKKLRLVDIVNSRPLSKLEWYANFAACLRSSRITYVKARRSRIHSLSFAKDCELFKYSIPKTRFRLRCIKELMTL